MTRLPLSLRSTSGSSSDSSEERSKGKGKDRIFRNWRIRDQSFEQKESDDPKINPQMWLNEKASDGDHSSAMHEQDRIVRRLSSSSLNSGPGTDFDPSTNMNVRKTRLHYEIEHAYALLSPSEIESETRKNLIMRLTDLVTETFRTKSGGRPNVTTHVVGSCATGLYLSDSDVDLVIMRQGSVTQASTIADLGFLATALAPQSSHITTKIGRAVQQECRDRSRMPSSA
eukprot:TRINITY_DN7877_c0_g1_i2.p1 TRINITY_DN7877_c0_g1~~TRINITY_DN7877_c0_g1_i2.p1  ORF type:complete len:259 (+),score=18.94 TRINITY_DN7877_c0_g1_i2:94-777(+)